MWQPRRLVAVVWSERLGDVCVERKRHLHGNSWSQAHQETQNSDDTRVSHEYDLAVRADALTLLHLLHLGGGIDMQKDLVNRSGTILSFSDILETVQVLVFEDAMQSFNSNAQ